MEGQIVSKFRLVQNLIKEKRFNEAQLELKEIQMNNQSLTRIVSLYHELSFDDQEEYQHFLQLLVCHITPNVDYGIYKDVVTLIISQMINLSSEKYTIVILRGVITKISSNKFGKWVILSNLYLFSSLIFDHAFSDIISLYEQFKCITQEILKDLEYIETEDNKDLQKIFMISASKILFNCLIKNKQKDSNKLQETIIFISTLIKNIEQLLSKKQEYQIDFKQIFGDLKLDIAPGLFLQKYDVSITDYIMPLPFIKILLKQQKKKQNQYESSILTKNRLNFIILSTLCLQLPESINNPPKITTKDQQILYQILTSFGIFLNTNSNQDTFLFIIEYYNKMQEFIQKINIFLGMINPQDQIYSYLIKNIIPLNFIPLISKQNILLKLIQKHTNQSFKIHLISQYRKLLTYKAPKGLWIRSIPLMIKQLGSLQPKTNVDYIGHIISFAYYWKGVSNKLMSSPNFIKTLYFDVNPTFSQFDQKLRELQKGLQKRLQFAQTQGHQQQRNEINVCLFRVEQLLVPIN